MMSTVGLVKPPQDLFSKHKQTEIQNCLSKDTGLIRCIPEVQSIVFGASSKLAICTCPLFNVLPLLQHLFNAQADFLRCPKCQTRSYLVFAQAAPTGTSLPHLHPARNWSSPPCSPSDFPSHGRQQLLQSPPHTALVRYPRMDHEGSQGQDRFFPCCRSVPSAMSQWMKNKLTMSN